MEACAVVVKFDKYRFQEFCNSNLYDAYILFLVDSLQDCHSLVKIGHRCGNSISCTNKQILCRMTILENYLPLIENETSISWVNIFPYFLSYKCFLFSLFNFWWKHHKFTKWHKIYYDRIKGIRSNDCFCCIEVL